MTLGHFIPGIPATAYIGVYISTILDFSYTVNESTPIYGKSNETSWLLTFDNNLYMLELASFLQCLRNESSIN
jgi:hypothetical protein